VVKEAFNTPPLKLHGNEKRCMHSPRGRVTSPGQVLSGAVGLVEAIGVGVVFNNAILGKEAFNTPPLRQAVLYKCMHSLWGL
jgi:hypothetical protein